MNPKLRAELVQQQIAVKLGHGETVAEIAEWLGAKHQVEEDVALELVRGVEAEWHRKVRRAAWVKLAALVPLGSGLGYWVWRYGGELGPLRIGALMILGVFAALVFTAVAEVVTGRPQPVRISSRDEAESGF